MTANENLIGLLLFKCTSEVSSLQAARHPAMCQTIILATVYRSIQDVLS